MARKTLASSRIRILFISSSWPLGDIFGGQLRALHTARALAQIGSVDLVVVGATSGDVEAKRDTEKEFKVLPPVLPELANYATIPQKLRRALDPYFLNVHGCLAPVADQARIASYLANYDLVWVLNARTPNILNRWHWPHSHLDIDDLPSTYARSLAHSASVWSHRLKARVQHMLLRHRERLLERRFSTLSVCSQPDRLYVGGRNNVHVIPNGFPTPSAPCVRRISKELPRIGFIGLYSYPPNYNGIQWFLRECWQSIREIHPRVTLRLIGKDTDGPRMPKEPGVEALGFVADPSDEISTWSAMIVPIHTGGGTRVKIAEAFSRKCPVVSTTLGAFGYGVADRNQLRIADHPTLFSTACIDLIEDPASALRMAERAWMEFLEKWTWDAITPIVWAAAEDCLRRSQTHTLTQ